MEGIGAALLALVEDDRAAPHRRPAAFATLSSKGHVPRWSRAMLPAVKPAKSSASQPDVLLGSGVGGSVRSTACSGAVTSPDPEKSAMK